MAIHNYNGVSYDDSVDYSAAIEQAKASGQDTTQLEAAREAKIADKYGGNEPNMYGSNQKYSDVRNDTSDAGRQTVSNAVNTASQIGGYDYSKPSNVSTNRNDYYGGTGKQGQPDMSRNPALAGMSVQQGQFTVTYNEDGYAVRALHDGGASATHGYQTTHANDTIYHQLAYKAAEQGNWDLAAQYMNMMSETYQRTGANNGDNTGIDYKAGRLYEGELKSQFNYNANAYYNNRYNQAYGENAAAVWDATGGAFRTYSDLVAAVGADKAKELVDNQIAKNPNLYNNPGSRIGGYDSSGNKVPTTGAVSGGVQNLPPMGGNPAVSLPSVGGSVNIGGGGSYKPGSLGDYLDDWLAAAQQQQTNTIDYGTNQAVLDLIRQQEIAEQQFQEQRNQIAIDEAKAKDNQALYAESRGDKGGIGAAQYDSIMNTAAQNRLQVNSAQQKLATDTARQIADLRAQGEYEKADALLSLSQQYLAQLINLEQWSMEYNLSVAQFNASLQQWAAEYEMAVSDLTGYYNGTPTLKNQQYQDELALTQQNQMASAGETLLSAGIMPSASQLAAMGISSDQAQSMITAAQLAATKKSSSTGGGGNPSTGGTKWSDVVAWVDKYGEDAAEDYIKENYKALGYSSQSAALSGWNNYQLESERQAWVDEMNAEADYNDFKQMAMAISAQLQSGNASSIQVAKENTARYWNGLTEAERQSLRDLYAKFGYTLNVN